MYAWCRQDVKATLKASFDEYIARKQGQRKKLCAVLPTVRSGIEREKGLESLARENPCHVLFVLVPSINRVPTDGVVGRTNF